ncbi:MAG: TATA-box-binding protein [Thermoplasmata archaeon]|nr:TATA-box-binding protein [Thermoplasmata archaeon]
MDVEIQNMVATTYIAKKLDLNEIAKALPNTSYRPNLFPGLVFHINEPKAAFLLFKSGKVVCTGAKNIENVRKAIYTLCDILSEKGFKVLRKPKIEIQNIVASANLHGNLNLTKIAFSIGLENVEYEPEVFPGMVYRMEEPRVVLLLFGSGKIVCTGAKKPEQVMEAVKKIRRKLEEKGLLM